MSGHTPGPWRFEPGDKFTKPYVVRGREGGFQVMGLSTEREEADAKLIAAAPDLLEALEAMVFAAGAVAVPHEGERKCLQLGVDIALKAIAKAKGDQP